MTRTPTTSFKELIVWQKAHQLVLHVYELSANFPQRENFGITAQLRNAAVSIPANIAEGYKRRGKKDKVRFFNIAQGSLEECHYYLILSKDLHYYENDGAFILIAEVGRLLNAYISAILHSTS